MQVQASKQASTGRRLPLGCSRGTQHSVLSTALVARLAIFANNRGREWTDAGERGNLGGPGELLEALVDVLMTFVGWFIGNP